MNLLFSWFWQLEKKKLCKNILTENSIYDIRKHFQGKKGKKMNSFSNDKLYNKFNIDLRNRMKLLAKDIEVKVYEYDFLV